MNFLNFGALLELVVVLGVLAYLVGRFAEQKRALTALTAHLETERAALEAARVLMQQARDEKKPPRDAVALLANQLDKDSAVWKRWRMLVQHQARHPEAAALGSRGFTAAEISRLQAATDDARFWSGAFVFIGLIGTLLCLGVAVFYLMLIVGRSGSSEGMTASLKDVSAHMTSTFLSMGLAFVNTGAGAGLTVWLSGCINRYEKQAENFRLDLEEFSLLDLEPLAAKIIDKDEDSVYLEEVVGHMEKVAASFLKTLEAAQGSTKMMGEAAALGASKLETASATFLTAADSLQGETGGWSQKVGRLAEVVERQETAQNAFIANSQAALQWLEAAVKSAHEMFAKLDGLREDVQKNSAATHALQREALERLETQNRDNAERGQSVFYDLKKEIIAGLQSIDAGIARGVESEEQIVKDLRTTIKTLADYTAHVENTLRQMPAALGSEPIIAFESEHAATMSQLSQSLAAIGGELSGLRGDVSTHWGAASADLKSVGAKVNSLQGGLQNLNGHSGALQTMQNDVSGLRAEVTALGSQVARMQSVVGRMEHSIVIPIGRGKGS